MASSIRGNPKQRDRAAVFPGSYPHGNGEPLGDGTLQVYRLAMDRYRASRFIKDNPRTY